MSRAGPDRTVVGGWGPILGDEGSGAWIGQQAARAAIAGLEGWAASTAILPIIRREWRLKEDWDMVRIVYRSPSPFRLLGSLTRAVAEAARENDAVAMGILREAGRLMAVQTICLLNRFYIAPADYRLVCGGGAWKTHPLMFETFVGETRKLFPDLFIRRPCFEFVMAGPVREMLARVGSGIPGGETVRARPSAGIDAEVATAAEARLAELFPAYVIREDFG